ncbi:MAG: hypothetical protein EXQ87_10990 [Alphaproteobacteria bacterium]|nr:hypothetical protein [Alphaproteobacteria bacterium]
MIGPIRAIFALFLLVGGGFAWAGAEPGALAKQGAWQAFILPDAAKPVCYALAWPAKSESAYAKRGAVYPTVTHRPADGSTGAVSFAAGYPLKTESQVSVQIGNESFRLYTVEETAWVLDADEKKLLAALRVGKEVVVKGISARGTATTDIFPLAGFQPALAAIDKARAVKR